MTETIHQEMRRKAAQPNPFDRNRCPFCGTELTFEDDGDGENGPHLSAYCANDDCPGDPRFPDPPESFTR